jgi:hypothetical protein
LGISNSVGEGDLSGEWNINFMQNSVKLNELTNSLLMCNLINTVVTPFGITQNAQSVFNVIVIRKNHINLATVLDLGFSDI